LYEICCFKHSCLVSSSTTTTTTTTTTSTTSTTTSTSSTTSTTSTSTKSTSTTSTSTTTTSTSTKSTSTTSTSTTTTSTTTTSSTTTSSNLETLSTTTPVQLRQHFIANSCNMSNYTGTYCNISNSLCNMLQPCTKNSVCIDISSTNYTCKCKKNFNGSRCLLDHRRCIYQLNSSNGTKNFIFNESEHRYCRNKTRFCDNVECKNNGVCRSLSNGFKCECLGDFFYGTYCENESKKLTVLKVVSKSVSYIAILAMVSVAMFVIVMDILKYGFGIDPVESERRIMRRERQAAKRRRRPVIQRFVYVNSPSTA